MPPFIEIQQVTLLSGDYEVLKEIDVTIPDGVCTVVLGPSGCGKSSFLKVAAGIYPPDTGQVLCRGKDLAKLPYKQMKEFRRDTGFVFEDSALWANRTLFDNLSLPLEFHNPGASRKEIRDRVFQALDKGGFASDARLRPEQLSSSERKVIAFLRGTINHPSHLFLDEPIQSIDHELARVIINALKQLKQEGATLVMVTNNPDITSKMADHLILLKEGRVVETGAFNVVKNSTNPDAKQILYEILGNAASFDTDILNLLEE